MKMRPKYDYKLRGDFNGVWGELLCLSHKDTSLDANGNEVALHEGMSVMAFEEDIVDDKPDDLIAFGVVERSPDWLQCYGSKWALRIDENGILHESDLAES